MDDSILNSVKKILGIEENYTVFDVDIIIHINTVLNILNQLGIGPDEGFMITGETETWDNFIGNDILLNDVKTYIYLRVRLIFDPPTTSFAIEALTKQYQELEWRMNVKREGEVHND